MIYVLITIALVGRLLLMPISAHSDLITINIFPNLLVREKVVDIFGYFRESTLSGFNQSYFYPPLTYFSFGTFHYFYKFVTDDFSNWMTDLYNFYLLGFEGEESDYILKIPNPNLTKLIFLAKTPYLVFDIAIVYLLYKFAKLKLLKIDKIAVWLLSPILIYSTYIFGQYEIIPAFFVFLGFFLLRKNITLAFLTFGVAAAFKNYAFVIILPLAIIYATTWYERIKLLFLSIIPFIVFLIPTLLGNYPQEAIYALIPKVYVHYRKPLEGWALYSQWIKYFLLTASYISLLVITNFLKIKSKWQAAVGISLITTLLVLAIAPRISFHYLLWSAPLILLWFKSAKSVALIFIVQAVSLASYKLLSSHLQAGLFEPANPAYFSKIPPINSYIDKIIHYEIISGIGFFVFLLFNLFLIAAVAIDLLFHQEVSLDRRLRNR